MIKRFRFIKKTPPYGVADSVIFKIENNRIPSHKSLTYLRFYKKLINSIKNLVKEFYLVEKDGKQLFATVTDKFIETRQPAKPITGNKFEIASWKYIKCTYGPKG